jgi:hypothetical protein
MAANDGTREASRCRTLTTSSKTLESASLARRRCLGMGVLGMGLYLLPGADAPGAQADGRAMARTVDAKLEGRVSIKEFGAAGNGAADDTAPITKAIASGKSVYFPCGTYLVSSALALNSGCEYFGDGAASIIRTNTPNHNLLAIVGKTNVVVRGLKLRGTESTRNGHGIVAQNCTFVTVRDCEFENFSNQGVRVVASSPGAYSRYVSVERCYFHDWTTNVVHDSAAIGFLGNAEYCSAINNVCLENSWHGIIMQGDSNKTYSRGHRIIGNHIGPHKTYGITCYQVTAGDQWTLVMGNTINDIDGATLGGTSGAGIYCVACGGLRIIGNRVYNANINTTTETLVPAALAFNGLTGDAIIADNQVEKGNWYGIGVFSNTAGRVQISGNVVSRTVKESIYTKDSTYVSAVGNTIDQDGTATGGAIRFRDTRAIKRKGLTAIGNQIIATVSRPLYFEDAESFMCSNNTVTITAAGPALEGMIFEQCTKGVVCGNMIDGGTNEGFMLLLNSVTKTRVSGNVLSNTGGAGRTLVQLSGICTDTVIETRQIFFLTRMMSRINRLEVTSSYAIIRSQRCATGARAIVALIPNRGVWERPRVGCASRRARRARGCRSAILRSRGRRLSIRPTLRTALGKQRLWPSLGPRSATLRRHRLVTTCKASR